MTIMFLTHTFNDKKNQYIGIYSKSTKICIENRKSLLSICKAVFGIDKRRNYYFCLLDKMARLVANAYYILSQIVKIINQLGL